MENHPGVERFNRLAAITFTELYEAFPDPVDLSSEYLSSLALPQGEEAGDLHDFEKSAIHVIEWLAAEGLLRYEKKVYGGYVQVVLSMKALTILGYTPEVLRAAPEPLVDRLKSAISKGAADATTTGVKQILGGIFDLALRYGQTATSTGTLIT
jgi:hypothetical protein